MSRTLNSSELVEIIRAEIGANGPIPFARFMELALYHPKHGYYASGRANISRRGDFFTNVSVGPLFGRLLAAQFAEIWEKLGRPRDFKIMEQGAHDGAFAADALSALRQSAPDCFAATSYFIIEPFPIWQERQQKNLDEFAEKTSWVAAIDEIQPFVGIHFSNELFDSLPVHLATSDAGDWQELFVTVSGNRFEFKPRSCSGGLRPPKPPARNYRTEVHRAALKLMHAIATKLSRGLILTIDYGLPREEFYSSERTAGTLQVRAKQKKLASPFEQIGLADISAHIEWTSLAEAAQSSGALPIGFTDQHHFLTGIISRFFPDVDFDPSEKRALQTLLHPEMLGRNFQVLALGKDFHEPLSGFRFARDPVAALGL